MQSTKAVRSLKKLFEGYHEPTLSRQQSQKLLDGLKASFRGHLDREYGQSPGSIQLASKSNDTDTAKPSPTAREPAAHQHLKELLSNPMFQYKREDASKSPIISSGAPPIRDPMEVFDHAVSRGMMTLSAATGILRAKRQEIQNTSDPKSKSTQSDVGLRVVRWLRSSHNATSLGFLDSPNFVSALMPFLVMEGMEAAVWEWFATVVSRMDDCQATPSQTQAASGLLRELVLFKAGSHENNNINEAITSLLQANEEISSTQVRDLVLPRPWRSVSWLATVDHFKTTTASEKLYDAHMATSRHFGRKVLVETAHLHLYHPTHPSDAPALELFQDTQFVRGLVQRIEAIEAAKTKPVALPPWIVVLGRDTMNFLVRAGKTQEADHLAGLLKSGLSSLFPSPDTVLTEHPRFAPP